jgi:hypothetical protein
VHYANMPTETSWFNQLELSRFSSNTKQRMRHAEPLISRTIRLSIANTECLEILHSLSKSQCSNLQNIIDININILEIESKFPNSLLECLQPNWVALQPHTNYGTRLNALNKLYMNRFIRC